MGVTFMGFRRLHSSAAVIGRLLLYAFVLSPCAAALADVPDLIFDDGFEPTCPGAPPGVTPGAGSGLLLRGTVVTPAIAFVGEVLVLGDTIACAAASCAGQPGADTVSVVETKGLIFPGLIDTHNVSLFDIFDENDWTPDHPPYGSHNDWTTEPQYSALVDAKQISQR
jgi:hypothetical protein